MWQQRKKNLDFGSIKLHILMLNLVMQMLNKLTKCSIDVLIVVIAEI